MPSALWAASPMIQKFFSRPNPNFGQSAPVSAEPAPATRKPRPFPDGRGFLLRLGHTTAGFIEATPELVYCRRALVDTFKPHCCWGPNGVSVWMWQGRASRIGRE